MKKFISILLVMVMMVSILAISASASEIEPRYVVTFCPRCDGTARIDRVLISSQNIWVTCPNESSLHLHGVHIYNENVNCANCGNFTQTITQTVCDK